MLDVHKNAVFNNILQFKQLTLLSDFIAGIVRPVCARLRAIFCFPRRLKNDQANALQLRLSRVLGNADCHVLICSSTDYPSPIRHVTIRVYHSISRHILSADLNYVS